MVIRQDFTCMPTEDVAHLLIEVPNGVVGLGLRRGAFADHSDWSSLCKGQEYVIRWKPEFLNRPFFVLSTPGGWGVDETKPMTDTTARAMLSRIAKKIGFGGEIVLLEHVYAH